MNPAEDYILNQNEPFRSMLLHIQTVVEHTITKVELKYKYKIPFYYINNKPFCYLNQSKNYIDVGFWNGHYLTVHLEHMTTAGRKYMKSLRYTSLEEINDNILIDVLKDAYSVNKKSFYK